ILQNGLNEQQAITAGGDGHFWATTNAAYCNWYAKPARLEFDLPEAVLQDLLSKPFMVDHVEPGDNYDFYPASFSILNAEMTNKHRESVPYRDGGPSMNHEPTTGSWRLNRQGAE